MGLVHKLGEVLDAYVDLRRGSWERLVRPVLQDIPAQWLAERTGLSTRTIQRLRNGHSRPRPSHESSLTKAAVEAAKVGLKHAGLEPPSSPLAILAQYLGFERSK